MNIIKNLLSKSKYLFAFFVSQFLLIQNANAQLGFTPPDSSDMSRQFINQIFGGLLDGGSDAFGGSIAAFNGAILIVGGILVAYTIFIGVLGTAHDGEMLGKKFSSVYVPVRTALGSALVLPIMSGGYCVMQSIVMWLIMQGVSLGNIVWSNYMSNPPALSAKVSVAGNDNIKSFIYDTYLAHVCLEAYKKNISTMNPETANMLGADRLVYTYRKDSNGVWKFGEYSRNAIENSKCGTVTPPAAPASTVTANAPTQYSSLNTLTSKFTSPNLTPIHTAHVTQMDAIVNATADIARRAVEKEGAVSSSELDALIANYRNGIQNSTQSILSGTNMNNVATEQGWFLAGTWVTKIIFIQNKVSSVVNSYPSASPVLLNPQGGYAQRATEFASYGYGVLSDQRPELAGKASNPGGENDKSDKAPELSFTAKALSKITSFVTTIDLSTVKTDTRHPLVLMSEVGNSLLNVILGGMVAIGVLSFAGTKILGTGLDLTPAYLAIYGTLAFPLAAFIGVAGMLAYILPNTPFLIWLGIIIGWTLMVVEAVIAAPLWAVMHLHPNGDDVTGRGGSGYMLILGLLLRPALIIFGLIAAIVLSDAFGKLVNLIFFDTFTSNRMDGGQAIGGGMGFFETLFGISLYATVMFMVIKNTFAIMHKIPDQLLQWIGGGGSQLGQYANEISEGSVQKGAAAAGAATAYAMKDTLQGASGTIERLKSLKEQKGAKDAQERGNQISQQAAYQAKDASDGTGAGTIDQKIDESFNGNSFGGMQAKSQASSAAQALGGKDSEFAAQYREGLLSSMSQDGFSSGDFPSAHEKAFSSAFDAKFGSGSYAVASQISSNATSSLPQGSKNASSVSSLSFASTSSALQSKMNNLVKGAGKSPEEARELIGGMMSNVLSRANNGEDVQSALKDESSKLNANVGIARDNNTPTNY